MKLILMRSKFLPDRTLGYLNCGTVSYFSLEDQVRPDPVVETAHNEAKVMHKTAIPEGRYPVIIDYSPRFKRELPHVLDVPGFEGVRIHPGNTPEDTSGCILVGRAIGSGGTLLHSRAAFDELFELMEVAYDKGEGIILVILSRREQDNGLGRAEA